MDKTICAISTPLGNGGIAIVRVSGSEAKNVVQKFVDKNIDKFEARKLYLCKIKTESFTEQGLVVYFKAPFSYTGEDLIEIQCHGGVFIATEILKQAVKSGAVLAQAGEFSKRAFLNGKLSLEAAEGVIDMINAESSSQVRAGYDLLNGNLLKKINEAQKSLTTAIAEMETSLDYPENDIEYSTKEKIRNDLVLAKAKVEELLSTVKTGKLVKNGINLLILGKPNVGKSSILNSLLGYDRAIVSNIAGTTRDIVQESFSYNGMLFKITDTAGIRESEDTVEQIGVKKAKEMIDKADIILCVLDRSEILSQQDKDLINDIKSHLVLYVYNKCDLPSKQKTLINPNVQVSAVCGENILAIKEKLYDMVVDKNIINSQAIITNSRHEKALNDTLVSLNNAIDTIDNPLEVDGFDLVVLDVRKAWESLGEITGETSNELIIDEIFSKFCLGK